MLYTKRNGLVGSSFNWKGVDVQDLLNKERRFGGIGYVAKTYEEAVKGVKAMAKVISENSNWLSTSKIKLEPVSEDMVSAKMTMVGFFNKEEQKNMAPGGNNPNTVTRRCTMRYTNKSTSSLDSSYDWRGVDVQDWLNNPEKGMINKGSNPLQKEVAMATYREVHGVLYIHQKGLFGALERTYKGWSSIFNPNWWSKYYLRNLPTLLWAAFVFEFYTTGVV